MSAKNFRFRSPGVRIEEIDESTFTVPVESSPGPVIAGRSQHGPILKPVIINSVQEFLDIFGTPSPGGAPDVDIWRGENRTAPYYGAFAALAYLRNSAPITFIRLGGTQAPNAEPTGLAGWQTTDVDPSNTVSGNGGAYGLWLVPSSSVDSVAALGTGSLAAIFYIDENSSVLLSGSYSEGYRTKELVEYTGTVKSAQIPIRVSASAKPATHGYKQDGDGYYKDVTITMDSNAPNFIRKAFNTSPIMVNSNLVDNREYYWLGETFEETIDDIATSQTVDSTFAFITPLLSGSKEKAAYRYPYKEAKTGYVFSQDLGASGDFDPVTDGVGRPAELFRFCGLTEGRWVAKNVKISISNISYTPINEDAGPYGSFNVEVRAANDTDDNVVLLESFENVNINPRSSRYLPRVIGDQYLKWDSTNNKIEVFGEFPNNSRYIRVELHPNLKVGAIGDSGLVPFGFMGPARRPSFQIHSGSISGSKVDGYTEFANGYAYAANSVNKRNNWISAGRRDSDNPSAKTNFTASLLWPDYKMRVSASNAVRGLATNAYFGLRTTRNDTSRYPYNGYVDLTYPLDSEDDSFVASDGVSIHRVAFSLDDVQQVSSSNTGWSNNAFYSTGNRKNGTSISATNVYYQAKLGAETAPVAEYSNSVGWKTVIDAGYRAFTMPMHGGFDGVDIKEKDPFAFRNYDGGATKQGTTKYAWYSIFTAIKMMRDPEFLEFDLAAVPGVFDSDLNTKLADFCKERGDALALLDVDSGYRPLENLKPADYTTTSNRGTVSGSVNYRQGSLNGVLHSYAAAYYPWVDILDGAATVAVPPTVAMLGVFGKTRRTSEPWFAPAGFQRGGLSDGTAGLRVVNTRDRLTSAERDELYDNGINPIANFPAEGVVVFGQKTLQLERSALDRINVRRLMIYLKREIGAIARRTLFEQNIQATWNNFTEDAVAVLEDVKDGLGLVDYKFVLDETTTTPDLIDQNILYAKLFVKPARAIEFVALDFIITKTGADFPE